MTGAELIAKFELYVDDSTELSSAEELDLLNKIYYKVASERPWEVLKKEATGTMTTTTTITLPSDFEYVMENYNYTDNSVSQEIGAKNAMVFINDSPVQLVNWSDRRQYEDNNSVCYVDLANSVIRFPSAQPSGATYSFDYKATPAALTTGTSPVFPARFHSILFHGMCVEDMAIQLFDKARSNADFNQAQYNSYLKDMAYWNASLQSF